MTQTNTDLNLIFKAFENTFPTKNWFSLYP
jgi:hypothetical protein